jgi:hypothetical protein
VDGEQRDRLARDALDGHVSGPDAPRVAAASALAAAASARSIVLVEGISDQIALETLAERHGRDLASEDVVIIPIGGAHAVARHLVRFGPQGASLAITGMCDAGEEDWFRRGLAAAGLGAPRTRQEMERLGFLVCVEDLEDELIRASDRASIEALLDALGDLPSFRSLQKQPAWRHESFAAQMHRFLGAGSGRKLRYARALVRSLRPDQVPRPLEEVLRRT